MDSILTLELGSGLLVTWSLEDRKDKVQHVGWIVVDLATVIVIYLIEVIYLYTAKLISC